ncbi:MAG: aminopeptidase [Nitrospirae bacterium]|nr:aminopeptidase [Nitrospirota bacterium]
MDKKIRDSIIKNIYNVNLNVKKNEKVLIFTDGHSKDLTQITKLIATFGKSFTDKVIYTQYKETGGPGIEPPESLWIKAFGKDAVKELKREKLLTPLLNKKIDDIQLKKIEKIIKKFKKGAVNTVIALSHYSTTHTRFRNLLTNICGARYASMPLFEESMLYSAMNVNYKEIQKRTKKITETLNKAEAIEIKTPNGTHIIFSKHGRDAKADTGIITKKGTYSNLPAGESFFAPLEGTAEGRLVLEWAPTRRLKNPVVLDVKQGMVVRIKGKEEYVEFLRKKLSERRDNANIAELGIGTNDKAARPDNILESEKILGTIHIALGDNSSFGGKVSTPFHQDFIFFKPTVRIVYKDKSKKLLIKNGVL